MLQSDVQHGDVRSAEDYMARQTARFVWQYLVDGDPEHKKFYYDKENAGEDIEIIRNCLKKAPTPLNRDLWNKLRYYGLVRTPQERRQNLLCKAPDSMKEATPYSKGLKRALMAVLALDPMTKSLEVFFKNGAEAALDLLLQGSRLLINDKWLDFHLSHEAGGCDLSLEASYQHVNIDTFDCGHVITELYDSLVAELCRNQRKGSKLSSEISSALCRRAGEKIRQTPARVTASHGAETGEIVVSWTESESDRVWKNHGLIRKGRVALHRESTCSHLRNELLSLSEMPEMPTGDNPKCISSMMVASCGCLEQLVPLKDSSAIFSGLSPEENYFPMISGVAAQSFFGLPPPSLRPAASGLQDSFPAKSNESLKGYRSTQPKQNLNEVFPEMNDASQDSDNSSMHDAGVRNDSTLQCSSTQSTLSGTSDSGHAGTPLSKSFTSTSEQARRSPVKIQLRNQKDDQTEQLHCAESEIRRLERELGTNNGSLLSLMNEVSRLNAEKETIRAELNSMTENCNEKIQQIQAANTEKQSQQLQLAEKEQALEKLRIDIQEKEQQQTRISASLAETESRLVELQLETESLRDSNQIDRGTIEALDTEIQHLQTHNEQLSEHLACAEADINFANQQAQLSFERVTRRKRIREAEGEMAPSAKRMRQHDSASEEYGNGGMDGNFSSDEA